MLKKVIAVILSLSMLVCGFSMMGTVSAQEKTTDNDLLSNSTLAVAVNATRVDTSLDYNEDIGGYQVNYKGTKSASNFMFMSDYNIECDSAYVISVDYKISSDSERVGIVFGADNYYGYASGSNTTCNNWNGANTFKSILTFNELKSGVQTERLRITSCDDGQGRLWANGSAFNQAAWVPDTVEFSNDWNTLQLFVSKNRIIHFINGVSVFETTAIKDISGYIGVFAGSSGSSFKNLTVKKADSSMDNFALSHALRASGKNTTLPYDITNDAFQVKTTVSNSKHYFFMSSDYNFKAGSSYVISFDYKNVASGNCVAVIFGASSVEGVNNSSGSQVTCAGLSTAYKVNAFPENKMQVSSCNGTNPYDIGSFNSGKFSYTGADYISNGWNNIKVFVTPEKTICYVNGAEVYSTTDVKNIGGYVGFYSYLANPIVKNFEAKEITDNSDDFVLSHALRASGNNTSLSYNAAFGGCQVKTTVSNSKHYFFMSPDYALKAGSSYVISVDYRNVASGNLVGVVFGASSVEGVNNSSGSQVTCAGLSTAYKANVYPNNKMIVSSCDGANPYDIGSFNSDTVLYTGADYISNGWNNIKVFVTPEKTIYYVNGVEVYSTTDIKNVGGYVGFYSYLANTSFKDFNVSILDKETIDMSQFVLSSSLRGAKANTSLVYSEEAEAYVIDTTAEKIRYNYFVSPNHNMVEGNSYTVSMEFKASAEDVIPQTGILLGATSYEGVEGTNADGEVVITCEGLSTAYRPWIYYDSGWQNDVFRMVKCDGTTNDSEGNPVWDVNSNNSSTVFSGRVAYYGYKANDWNKMTVKIAKNSLEYYINDRLVWKTTEVEGIGGYVGVYAYSGNIMYKNFTVTDGIEATADDRTVVACVGDSITQGVKATYGHHSYPFQLQKRLGDNYNVLNFGKSGYTAVKGYEKSYAYTEEYAESLASEPDIVVIMLGTNDANLCWDTLGSALYESDLKEMIESYKALPSNPQIYLCTTPYSLNAELNTTILSEVLPIQQSLASEYGCELISMYAFLEGKDSLFADELHPNSNGYSVMADKFANTLTGTKYGDVNGDKDINILDLVRMKKVIALAETVYIRSAADIDFDGSVAAGDLTMLRKHLLGTVEIGGNEVESTEAQLVEEMSSIG